jgi:hypothetical protein
MPHTKSDTQPEEKSDGMHLASPYYLPFEIVQIKQSDQHLSSVEEAQADFVAQAGMPKALSEESPSENSGPEK